MYGAWKEVFNEEKQKPFYKNVETGESTWKVPADVAAMKAAGTAGVPVAAASASPSSTADRTAPAAAPAAAAAAGGASASPARGLYGDWKELYDAGKGKCYYVHQGTKERTWDVSKTSFA